MQLKRLSFDETDGGMHQCRRTAHVCTLLILASLNYAFSCSEYKAPNIRMINE